MAETPRNPTRTEGYRGRDRPIGPAALYYPESGIDAASSQLVLGSTVISGAIDHYFKAVGRTRWTIEPADETDEALEAAEDVSNILFENLEWEKIVKRLAGYQLWGAAVLEHTMERRENGDYVYSDVASRAYATLKYETNEYGDLTAVVQNPNIRIPREKIVYAAENALSDVPQGLGLFSMVRKEVSRLFDYFELERTGFELNMRGTLKVFAPITEVYQEGAGEDDWRHEHLEALRQVAEGRKRGQAQALFLDSEPFRGDDNDGRPTALRKMDAELMQGSSDGARELQEAIRRLEWNVASAFGMESMKLGEASGSRALVDGKNDMFRNRVDDALDTLRRSFQRDLIGPLFRVNTDWNPDLVPRLAYERPKEFDPMAAIEGLERLEALRSANPDDPAIPFLRSELGLPAAPRESRDSPPPPRPAEEEEGEDAAG